MEMGGYEGATGPADAEMDGCDEATGPADAERSGCDRANESGDAASRCPDGGSAHRAGVTSPFDPKAWRTPLGNEAARRPSHNARDCEVAGELDHYRDRMVLGDLGHDARQRGQTLCRGESSAG